MARSVFLLFAATALCGCSENPSHFADPSTSSSIQSIQLSANTSGGNGDYYGGKPSPGVYQRFNGNSVIEKLKVTEDSAELLKLDTTGEPTVSSVRIQEIEFASYLPGRVGVGNGLYTKSSVVFNEGVSESWCRKPGSTSHAGYDIVVEKLIQASTYRAKVSETVFQKGIYIGDRTAVIENVTQDRNSGDRVRYRANGFELEIRFATFNSVSGKFQGRLRFDQDAQVDTAIDCRVGGVLNDQIPKL